MKRRVLAWSGRTPPPGTKINVPNNREEKRSINNGGEGVVSDYFQV